MQQHARHFARRRENDRVGTGQMRLEQAEGGGVDLGEQAQLRQVAAGRVKLCLSSS